MIPYLRFVWRRRWPILVFLPILSVGVVIAITPRGSAQPTRYTSAVYLAGDPEVVNQVMLSQAGLDVKQQEVTRLAAEKLGEEPEDLKRFATGLRVKTIPDSLTIRLSHETSDRPRAFEYPKAFADAFLEVSTLDANEARLQELSQLAEVQEAAQARVTEFRDENRLLLDASPPDPVAAATLSSLQQLAQTATSDLQLAQSARQIQPYRLQNTDGITEVSQTKLELPNSRPVRAVLALFLGVVGAAALTAFIERLNPRIDSPTDAERIAGAPVLAMVPVMKGRQQSQLERAELSEFSGPFAESFRAMRSHLDFRSAAAELGRPPCVMISSSAPNEGKTTSAAFLALTYAEVGRDVVVVGADFRRPAIHRLFGVPLRPGLSSRYLNDQASKPADARNIVSRDVKTGVRVVPSGPATSRVTGLLGDLEAVVAAAQKTGATVVVDTPPVMVANDAVDYLPMVDMVLLVVRLGRTTERALRQTVASLELNNANIAGCIMVGSLESSDAKRYYYSYYKVDDDSENVTGVLTDRILNPPDEPGEADGAGPGEGDAGAGGPGGAGSDADDPRTTPSDPVDVAPST